MIKLVLLDIDGVITDGQVLINSSGEEFKRINFKDIDGIFEIKRKGLKLGFITGENTSIVKIFKERFNPDYFYSGRKDKVNVINEIISQCLITIDEVCYVGDGKSDIEAIKIVGLGICPKDAIQEVKNNADIVLSRSAGQGCLYELVNILEDYNSTKNNSFQIQDALDEKISIYQKIKLNNELQASIKKVGDIIVEAFKNNNKLLLCGNGGSAADAQHIATEFVGRFFLERGALNAEALTVNTSTLTAIGNDYDFERIFSRQIEAKGNIGDVLLAISTSGKSKNILAALKEAKNRGMNTIIFTGGQYEPVDFVDEVIKVPSINTPRIQEVHIFVGHIICEYVERSIFS